MNKQDKIKKVMREFKDGKLKTPNGEVVTNKNAVTHETTKTLVNNTTTYNYVYSDGTIPS